MPPCSRTSPSRWPAPSPVTAGRVALFGRDPAAAKGHGRAQRRQHTRGARHPVSRRRATDRGGALLRRVVRAEPCGRVGPGPGIPGPTSCWRSYVRGSTPPSSSGTGPAASDSGWATPGSSSPSGSDPSSSNGARSRSGRSAIQPTAASNATAPACPLGRVQDQAVHPSIDDGDRHLRIAGLRGGVGADERQHQRTIGVAGHPEQVPPQPVRVALAPVVPPTPPISTISAGTGSNGMAARKAFTCAVSRARRESSLLLKTPGLPVVLGRPQECPAGTVQIVGAQQFIARGQGQVRRPLPLAFPPGDVAAAHPPGHPQHLVEIGRAAVGNGQAPAKLPVEGRVRVQCGHGCGTDGPGSHGRNAVRRRSQPARIRLAADASAVRVASDTIASINHAGEPPAPAHTWSSRDPRPARRPV